LPEVRRIGPESPRLLALLNPFHRIRDLVRLRALVQQFALREVQGRYRGTALGAFWLVAQPLTLLAIYTFLFGVVFRARWPEAATGGLAEFALAAFSGLVVFSAFSESATRAPYLVAAAPNYVRKVVFPLEVLPVAAVLASLLQAAIGLVLLAVAEFVLLGHVPWTAVLAPVVFLPLALLAVGTSWLLASLGVFVRDLAAVVPLLLQILFFLTPIVYPFEMVPARFRPLVAMNPLAILVDAARGLVLFGRIPDLVPLALVTVFAAVVAMGGLTFFLRTRRAFADVV
jgi:lipopolysaccharide transport system permease protein